MVSIEIRTERLDPGEAETDAGNETATVVAEKKEAAGHETSEDTGAKKADASVAKKVFICSPYHPEGDTEEEIEANLEANIRLARFAAYCVIKRGGIPYAPHLYFPEILDEDDPEERDKGIALGLKWLSECDEIWVVGRKISPGMRREIKAAHELKIPMKHILKGDNARDRLIEAITLLTDDDGNLL